MELAGEGEAVDKAFAAFILGFGGDGEAVAGAEGTLNGREHAATAPDFGSTCASTWPGDLAIG